MGIINKSFRLSWITSFVAASLLTAMGNSGAQDTTKTERAERAERAERSERAATAERSGKSEKGEHDTVTAHLTGDKEVPAVQTNATGKSTIKVETDKSISGKVTVENMTATAAHIHQGPPDKEGPIIIPLEKTSKNTFSVPAHKKLTDDQFAAFKDGNLYVNVHSKKYPGGEVRAQMKP
ncbi:MAG: CHRD domain-containing protein [Methanosarcina sp.]